ncbi:MAG: DegT/DnrJ/EryC1/StrS family aminotransferase [Candidatus Omnitrophica bacterium]|nr:DegT/DnrJ/EryC1/StrS family aminotransferase [Candidatus Omnitrophota bacterium]
MKIPFSDVKAQHRQLKNELEKVFARVVKKGDFILGEEVRRFENDFARFCGSRYAIGTSSGTAALFLALRSLGIGRGDEVIIPAFTYIATAFAVTYAGATPVFVDIRDDTYTLDTGKILKAITKHTKAIIPVHLYGQPACMAAICAIAKNHRLKIVEDVAQAHGAAIKTPDGKWHTAGNLGDIGCFSFYPSKNLGGLGDGGMLVTSNEALYRQLRILRDCGRISKYDHVTVGYNARLDTLQAALLRVKLTHLKRWNTMRQKAAQVYKEVLKDIPGVVVPFKEKDRSHVYHVYGVRIPHRDKVFESLSKKNISCIIHYPKPLHLQTAYKELGYRKGDFPVSEMVAREIISLPMYPHIKKTQIVFVANALKVALTT